MNRTPVTEREVTISRLVDAPRDLVWEAWTKAEHVKNWWGPKSFTNPICEWEAKPGGKILIHMQGPEGSVHPMTGDFREVVAPEKLVFNSIAIDAEGNPILESLTTVTFTEQGDKTVMNLHAKAVGYIEIASEMLKWMEAGWLQSLEKLDDLLGGIA
jgi:uncharacterized protein YndB with AHSA1/START domain